MGNLHSIDGRRKRRQANHGEERGPPVPIRSEQNKRHENRENRGPPAKRTEEDSPVQITRIIEAAEKGQILVGKFAKYLQQQEDILRSLNRDHGKRPFSEPSTTDSGQCSKDKNLQQPDEFCPICMEPKYTYETYIVEGCYHVFCLDCIHGHISARIGENEAKVRCPKVNCKSALEIEFCREVLQPEVFERWGDILCESAIAWPMKFYCPFNDCSALLVNESRGADAVSKSKCPHCLRWFCAKCKVPSHSGFNCKEFGKLKANERGEEDSKLMVLAEKKRWRRCPKCRIFVEKTGGCSNITCRCGERFYYNGGGQISYVHINTR